MFGYGGITRPMQRYTASFLPTNWAQAKAGFGDDISAMADSSQAKFFIGLEKLHQLTRQANYNQNIMVFYNNWSDMGHSFYDTFTVGKCSG